MNTGKRVIQKITAMLLIFIITIADFALVGQNAISYAIEAIATNNKNVEILAYFVNGSGEQVTNIDSAIDATDLKLITEVTVKNDSGLGGYFDGVLQLNNANFKFKDTDSVDVKVDAGETKKIEKEIEYLNTNELTSTYLSQESQVSLTGKYVNSKKEYSIEGTAKVTINWKSTEQANAQLSAKILTNSAYTTASGDKKQVVQVLISSKLADNSYPVKNTKIDLNVPQGAEQVTVHKRETYATNGNKDFNENNYQYDEETGTLKINIENNEENGKISWVKNSNDILIATYIYPENTELINSEITINSTITAYDNKELNANTSAKIEETVDGIVTNSIIETENKIYKGKIYTGEDRNYETTTQINIDYIDAIATIEIKENKAVFVVNDEEKQSNIQYVKTTINKQEFENLFGEDGNITIQNQDGNTVANITKDSEVDENGNIVINYGAETTNLIISTTKPVSIGILNIKHEKKIAKSNYSREDIQSLTGIKENVETSYTKNDGTSNNVKVNKTITLEETESNASIDLETTSLSTTQNNQEIKFTVTLDTSDESKDLYKEPTIKIIFPAQITDLKVKYGLVYGNGLEKNKATISVEDGKQVLTISLKGEQTSYSGEAINGTKIVCNATANLNSLAVSSKSDIILNYTNKNAIKYSNNATETYPINIVAENSMIITNNAENAKVSTFGKDESKEIKLDIGSEEKKEKINMQIINNEGSKISNISILGKLPIVENKIERASEVKVSKEAKVYYTSTENPTIDVEDTNNAWTTENNKNATHYLIKIDSLENAEQVDVNYELSIAKNLEYNIASTANYAVTYTNSTTNIDSTVNSSTLTFTTGTSAVIEETLTAIVGADTLNNGDEVKAGEIIKYTATITNSGAEDAKDVNITAKIPDGTTLLEVNPDYLFNELYDTLEEGQEMPSGKYYLEKEDREIKKENITIEAGKKSNYTYIVRVNSDIEDQSTTEAEISATFKEETKTAKIQHTLKTSNISATLVPLGRFETDTLESGYDYEYLLKVSNISDKDQEDVEVSINNNDLIKINGISYLVGEELIEIGQDTKTFKIEKISAGETLGIRIATTANVPTTELNTTEISAIIKDSKNNTARSNVIRENVQGLNIKANISSTTSSQNTTGYVNSGDEIIYTIKIENAGKIDASELNIQDEFSDYLNLESITLNGNNCEYNQEIMANNDYSILHINIPLKAGESAGLVIKAKVNNYLENTETLNIKNKATIYNVICLTKTEEISYYLEAQKTEEDCEVIDKDIEPIDDSIASNSNNTYNVSGTVWLDENRDGSKDSEEALLEGIKVYAMNIEKGDLEKNSAEEIISTVTNSDGFYTLNLPESQYLILFEYDTEKYEITTYQAEGVAESKNSNAIKYTYSLNNETKNVAATDSIILTNSMANVNLGLTKSENFNLELQKYISKIVVTNEAGTNTYDQADSATLAKVEIGSKYLSGTNVVIEYIIKVTNTGEAQGYVKNIVDYLPSELNFSSSLNSDWYQSGENIYNASLANTIINPGETKEVKLILTKTMTSSNTGLINNQAEIESSYSVYSTDNDKSNNKASADIIIGIKTGAVVSYILLTLTIIIVICGVAYLINKKILKDKIKI